MTSAGRELLKWVALLLMTGDHVNKVLLHGSQPWLTEAARVVFPIFAVVLAFNLAARLGPAVARRAMIRMLAAAALVQPFHALAFGYFLPLNVLFTLALGVYVCTAPRWLGAVAWVVGGLFVDYQWFGVGVVVAGWFCVAGYWYRDWVRYGAVVAAVASLAAINGNWWALAALPLLWLLRTYEGQVPRWRWTFYGYYVAHLVLLAALAG